MDTILRKIEFIPVLVIHVTIWNHLILWEFFFFNRLYTTGNRSDVILDLRCEGYISWPMTKAWGALIMDFYRLNKVFSTLYFCFSLTFSLKLYLFICIWSWKKKKIKETNNFCIELLIDKQKSKTKHISSFNNSLTTQRKNSCMFEIICNKKQKQKGVTLTK